MEGSAHYWFKAWKEKAKNRSWEGLKEAVVVRFGERKRGTIFDRVATNKQSRTAECPSIEHGRTARTERGNRSAGTARNRPVETERNRSDRAERARTTYWVLKRTSETIHNRFAGIERARTTDWVSERTLETERERMSRSERERSTVGPGRKRA
ncbi:hypothetical protein V8G54_016594, partial [Vigna mungo]